MLECEGELCQRRGRVREAVRCFEIAWAMSLGAGELARQAHLAGHLASYRLQWGEVEPARRVLLEALRALDGAGLEGLEHRLQHELAIAELARGRPVEAMFRLLAALDLYDLPTEGLRRAERWWMQARIETVRDQDLEHVDLAYRRSVAEFLSLHQGRWARLVLAEYLEFCELHGREVADCLRALLRVLKLSEPLEMSAELSRLRSSRRTRELGEVSRGNLRQLMAAARERRIFEPLENTKVH